MTNVFAVVGAHHDDPGRLLLLGEDGRHYAYAAPDAEPAPVEPAPDEWALDPDADPQALFA